MIGQYLPNKTKVVLFIVLKCFHNLNVALILGRVQMSESVYPESALNTVAILFLFSNNCPNID
jgi:hypothetical protein